MSDFCCVKNNSVDMTKLIEEINTIKYENYNVLVKLDNLPVEFHFLKTVKHFS